MPLFRRASYDRARILDAAARARARKHRRSAIELYRQVLVVEPQNAELHLKLAPLLAETGAHFDAFESFRFVAECWLRKGEPEKALVMYREAARQLPREVRAWEAAALLQQRAGRQEEALDTLLEGSRNFRRRRYRAQAIHLLRRAREMDEWNFEVVLEQAKLLDRSRQVWEAQQLLEGLAERVAGLRLRRVRAAQLFRSPTPAAGWRWLRQLFADAEAVPAARPERRIVRTSIVPLPATRPR